MNGYKEEYDEDEKMMLEQVRENLLDVLKEEHDDFFLLKFLKARSFHEQDTEEMLRTHLRWRKHFSVDYLINDYKPPESFVKYLRLSVLGFSDEGDLIRILRLRQSDLKGVILSNTSLDIDWFMAYILTTDTYLMDKYRKKEGHGGETVIYIADFNDFNVYELPWKYTLSLLVRQVRIFEANFPEHLNSVYLINCPTVVYYVLKILKPFMSEVTASKIHIFGQEGYQEELLKKAKPELLPDFLGGIRNDTEDDNTCTLLSMETEKIPESSYCCNAKRLAATDPGVTEVTVERRNFLCIDVEVPDSNYAVIWEVDIQAYDLGVGFSFRENPEDSDNHLKSLKPAKRLKSEFSPFVGMHICEHPGKYALVFDNGYSYFTNKTVLYRIQVRAPIEEKQ